MLVQGIQWWLLFSRGITLEEVGRSCSDGVVFASDRFCTSGDFSNMKTCLYCNMHFLIPIEFFDSIMTTILYSTFGGSSTSTRYKYILLF